eukprot:scaffold23267_cov112-Isochrysis_galbana.AAC.1
MPPDRAGAGRREDLCESLPAASVTVNCNSVARARPASGSQVECRSAHASAPLAPWLLSACPAGPSSPDTDALVESCCNGLLYKLSLQAPPFAAAPAGRASPLATPSQTCPQSMQHPFAYLRRAPRQSASHRQLDPSSKLSPATRRRLARGAGAGGAAPR